MRDLCLMNADKTDNSNTTGPGIKCPVLYFQGKTNWKANLLEIYMLKSKDLLEKQKVRDIKEIIKSLSDGSSINPTREQKFTTGSNCHKDKSVGKMEKIPRFLQGNP